MPEIVYYTVTQTREVRVTANNAEDAALIATAAFTNGQNSDAGVIDGPHGVWGNTGSRIKVTGLEVKRRA